MIQVAQNHSVAVFIDVENIHYSTINEYGDSPDWELIVSLCEQQGRINLIQAFADWRSEFADDVDKMLKSGIRIKFVPHSRQGKSSLDSYLIVSAMKLFFHNKNIDTLIIASGDRDYIPMIHELRAMGIIVIILAIEHTLSKDLSMVVDKVINYVPQDIHAHQIESVIGKGKITESDCLTFVQRELKELEISSDDGWVNLAFLGLTLKKKDASFSHRALGYSKLIEFLATIENIDIKHSEDGLTAFAKTKQEAAKL